MLLKYILILAFIVLAGIESNAQMSFATSKVLQSRATGSEFSMGIGDVNGDYRDDLIRLIEGNQLNTDLQVTGTEELINNYILSTPGGTAWTMNIGDLNNNGLNDFITAGFYNGAHIYKNDGKGIGFTFNQETIQDFYAQASNLVDIDNDGFLDLFICNDDGISKVFINDKTGRFTENKDIIDMVTVPASDNSGNYGSVWSDVDGDGDMDLFIAKCKSGADDFDDPRRINTLFINEDGEYVERGKEFGLASGAQSWTTDFADIDNDGDLDCYVANHLYRHILYENIDNKGFEEIVDFAGEEILSNNIQSFFQDFDNDGFVDIMVSGPDDFILRNNGDKSFERLDGLFGAGVFQSCVSGDLNHDGYVDLVVSYFNGIESTTGDVLFLNEGNDNKFLTIALKGYESNSNGVGATIRIFGSYGQQMRVVKSGLSYGISNSIVQRFGLGDDLMIDSLIINWPSGTVDRYYDLQANQHLLANEGLCLSELADLEIDGSLKICDGDMVDFSLPGYDTYQWSTGEVTPTITIEEESLVNVQAWEQACYTVSNHVFVENINGDRPNLSIDLDQSFCYGDSLILETDFPGQVFWSNDETSSSTIYTETGPIWMEVQNSCGTFRTDTLNVEFLNANIENYYEFLNDSVALELTAPGNNVLWYNDIGQQNIVATGNLFETGIINKDTVFYVQNIEQPSSQSFSGGASVDDIDPNNKYSNPFVNGALIFRVDKPMVLNTVKVETEELGKRRVVLLKNGEELDAKIIDIVDTGISTLQLDFPIEEIGTYSLTTDIETNMAELGTTTSWFARLDKGVNFPYALGGLGEIINSEWGVIYYHHFFDWEVSELKSKCIGNLATYTIETDFTSSVQELDSKLKLFPNPSSDVLNVQHQNIIKGLRIFDGRGQVVFDRVVEGKMIELDLSSLMSGVYLIEIHVDNQKEVYRFTKF